MSMPFRFVKHLVLRGLLVFAQAACVSGAAIAQSTVPNGDFETGTTSGWTFGSMQWLATNGSPNDVTRISGNNPGTGPNDAQYAIIPNSNPGWSAYNSGTEPRANFRIPFTKRSKFCLRVGNHTRNVNWMGEWAAYSFVVTPATQKFTFRWAAVLEHHSGYYLPRTRTPQFEFNLVDSSGASFANVYNLAYYDQLNQSTKLPNAPNAPSFTFLRPSAFRYNLPSSMLGQTVTAYFMTWDCPVAEHAGYAYVDDMLDPTVGEATISSPKTSYCFGDQIIVDGSDSIEAMDYTWMVQKCDANGSPIGPVLATKGGAGVPGTLNVNGLLAGVGKAIECPSNYKISLSITPLVVDYGQLTGPPNFLGGNSSSKLTNLIKGLLNNQSSSSSSNVSTSSVVIKVACLEAKLSLDKATYCFGDQIIANPTGSKHDQDHTWTLVRLDASGNEVLSSKRSQTINSVVSGNLNVASWYAARGGQLICDAKYKLTLGVKSGCSTTGKETSTTFTYSCCKELSCCGPYPLKFAQVGNTYLYPTAIPGEYGINPQLTRSGGPATRRVEATLVNAVRATSPWSGYLPGFAYISATQGVASTPNLSPVTSMAGYLRIARWESASGVLPGTEIYPLTLRVPAPIAGKQNFLRFTLKFTTYDGECLGCEAYQTFIYRTDGPGPYSPLPESSWPVSGGGGGGWTPDATILGNEVFDPRKSVPVPAKLSGRRDRLKGPDVSAGDKSGTIWPPSNLSCCPPGNFRSRPAGLRRTASPFAYAFSPQISWLNASRVEVTMVRAIAAAPNGPTYPIHGFIHSPGNIPLFAPPQLGAVPFSHSVRWVSSGAPVNNLGLPMMLYFPSPPATGKMYLSFTMRYSATQQTVPSPQCHQCDHYQTYYFCLEKAKDPVAVQARDWPVQMEVDPGNDGSGAKRRPPPSLRTGGSR